MVVGKWILVTPKFWRRGKGFFFVTPWWMGWHFVAHADNSPTYLLAFFFCSKCLNFNFTKMPHFTKLNLSRPEVRPCEQSFVSCSARLWMDRAGGPAIIFDVVEPHWLQQLWSHDAVVIEMERNRNAAKADISINGSITALHVLRIQDYSTGMVGVVPHGSFFFFFPSFCLNRLEQVQ